MGAAPVSRGTIWAGSPSEEKRRPELRRMGRWCMSCARGPRVFRPLGSTAVVVVGPAFSPTKGRAFLLLLRYLVLQYKRNRWHSTTRLR